jgi:DEAD/DEAH box helicase domain-containing protein
MSLNQLLSHWRAEPTIYSNITEWRMIEARSAQTSKFPDDLHPSLKNKLIQRGINHLFRHQETSWYTAKEGKNVIIVTGTASGKSLAYNLPILDSLLKDEHARALYLFPTKALSQDQQTKLLDLTQEIDGQNYKVTNNSPNHESLHKFPVPIAVYDGDTKSNARRLIRENARIILTNPDMLHMGILPHHTQWAEFFTHLKYIVLDEIHVYRGVFGSHVANVLRRIKRVAQFYGSKPQFFLTSATIANPVELGENLIDESIHLVDQDGSSRGPINFLIYNPPVIDPDLGLRKSSLLESVRLAEDLFYYDVQTIIFGRSRRNIELILTYLRQNLVNVDSKLNAARSKPIGEVDLIRGYRSGYLPEERRIIEAGLRSGKVRTVVATNALELGIDIGAMNASILVGYPGSIASTWQQAGRAGRGDMPSLAIFVTTASPLDQFLAHNPAYFFERTPEKALINPDNLLILLDHLRCALFEFPFEEGETFGNLSQDDFEEYLNLLIEEGIVHKSNQKYFWLADQYPADGISLRVASPRKILLQIHQNGYTNTVGEVDYESSQWLVHPNAVYIQESQVYLVDDLDLDRGIAQLNLAAVDYYTIPKVDTKIDLIEQSEVSSVNGGEKFVGELSVTSKVTGYKQVRWFTHEQIGIGDLDLPENVLQTMGYWLGINQGTVELLRQKGLWSSDPNQYGPNWIKQRKRARTRDNFKCQVCGREEGDKQHHVHHKTPFRQFDSYLIANQLDNLVTLCPACHRRVEAAVRLRSGLSGLSFVLSNLAPIFLMCDSRDLGVYSDPQSPLTNGNPAIVLYERIPAGIGFSQRLFEVHDSMIKNAIELVSQCECRDGCPSCIGPAGENGFGGKQETKALLSFLSN